MLKRALQTVVVACLAIVIPTIASAENGAKRVEVHYSDLKLTNDADIATLYSRLRRAAHQVCDESDILSIAKMQRAQACVEQALDRAIADVNVEALSELHAQNSPTRFSRELSAAR